MSTTQQYAEYIAADSLGFVYVGIGTAKRDLVAYEIATGRHRSILPARYGGTGFVDVYRGADGCAWASTAPTVWLGLHGWNATVDATWPGPALPACSTAEKTGTSQNVCLLPDGRKIFYTGGSVTTETENTNETHVTGYTGRPLNIFRIGLGPCSFSCSHCTLISRPFFAHRCCVDLCLSSRPSSCSVESHSTQPRCIYAQT